MRSNATAAALFVLACPVLAAAQQPETALLNGLTRDLACAPASPRVRPTPTLTVVAGRDAKKNLFGTGDALVIKGGVSQGLKVGDEFFVRRIVDDKFTEQQPGVYPISISTSGMVQIVEVQAEFSIATITYGCDGVIIGDYLERYERPSTPSGQSGAAPDFAHPARLILGAERRQVAGPGEFMVLDRGSDHGLRKGQQLTVFRRTVKDGPVAMIGTATVYTVQAETSVVRIDNATDAIYAGDLVAIHR